MKRLLAATLVTLAPAVHAQDAPIYLSIDVQRNGAPVMASKLRLLPGKASPVLEAGEDLRFQVMASATDGGADVQYAFIVPDGFGSQTVVRPRLIGRHGEATAIEWTAPLGVSYRVTALSGLREPLGR